MGFGVHQGTVLGPMSFFRQTNASIITKSK